MRLLTLYLLAASASITLGLSINLEPPNIIPRVVTPESPPAWKNIYAEWGYNSNWKDLKHITIRGRDVGIDTGIIVTALVKRLAKMKFKIVTSKTHEQGFWVNSRMKPSEADIRLWDWEIQGILKFRFMAGHELTVDYWEDVVEVAIDKVLTELINIRMMAKVKKFEKDNPVNGRYEGEEPTGTITYYGEE